MAQYKKYNDGMEEADSSLAEDGYNYYGYTRWGRNTQWSIKRVKADLTETRWLIGKSAYSTAWTNHATLTGWKRANEFALDT